MSELRLHLHDNPDAGRRATETAEQYARLIESVAGKPLGLVPRWRMHCDDCGVDQADEFDTFDEARAAAHDDGWITVGVDDFCVECRPGAADA